MQLIRGHLRGVFARPAPVSRPFPFAVIAATAPVGSIIPQIMHHRRMMML